MNSRRKLRAFAPVAHVTLTIALIALLASCVETGETSDKGYPNKDITVIVPFGAGGTTDAPTRAVAPCMEKELGVSFVIENREGGAGTIGTTELVGSKPDGYTLGVISPSSAVVAPLVTDGVEYDSEDIDPVGVIYGTSSVLGVSSKSKFKSAKDLLTAAKTKQISVASPGANTGYSFEIKRLAKEHGLKLKIVPFDSDAEVRNAVIGGNVDAMFSTAAPATLQLGTSGKLKLLATGGPDRPAYAKDLPTLDEVGYEGIVHSPTFFALAGPKGLSKEVSKALENALKTCREDKKVRERIGKDFMKDDFMTGDAVRKQLATLEKTFQPLAKSE